MQSVVHNNFTFKYSLAAAITLSSSTNESFPINEKDAELNKKFLFDNKFKENKLRTRR